MAYNYFPMNYPQMQYPYQQSQQYSYQQQPQQYTPPTIHAEIVQVAGEQEVKDYPLAAGVTQMFMSKDDKNIFIKTAYANSPAQIITYSKAEPVTEPTPEYVTKEELDKRLNDIINRFKNNQPKKQQEGVKNG